ncbi:alcohol dehydrogenase catalytic domain-containing protein [Olivibacter jilunii]
METPVFPSTLGYDAAGIVDAIGPGVIGFELGDNVNILQIFSLSDYRTYG